MRMNFEDRLIRRVWDIEEVKKLVSKRVFYIASDRRAEELNDLWVGEKEHKETASFGRNWGYYIGIDAIRKYYVDAHRLRLAKQMRENGAAEENLGNLYAHPCSTGLVELAGDGKTAKGLWYSISQETTAKPDGTAEALWIMEKCAFDFIKEGKDWKIWHLVIATDLDCRAGTRYSEQPVYVDWSKDPVRKEFGTPTREELIHDTTFNWWDGYPSIPEPYETFTDAVSYGPEGYRPRVDKGWNAGEGRRRI